MANQEILLIGGGGHCRSVIDVIELEDRFKIGGVIDNNLPLGSKVLDYRVIGKDEDLIELRDSYQYALVTVGQIESFKVRVKLFELLKGLNFKLPTIISPRAYISRFAKIEEGSIVMHDALINANARVGKNCIINSKALIEHDATIEDFCHISTGAIVNGGVVIKQNSFIGSNATIREGLEIKENSFIKAGSLIK